MRYFLFVGHGAIHFLLSFAILKTIIRIYVTNT